MISNIPTMLSDQDFHDKNRDMIAAAVAGPLTKKLSLENFATNGGGAAASINKDEQDRRDICPGDICPEVFEAIRLLFTPIAVYPNKKGLFSP